MGGQEGGEMDLEAHAPAKMMAYHDLVPWFFG